ncbi:MAG: diacylglycerol kinase [Candidatus Auribacterota bacterium]|nr:diacylglycerol kinase [Candidatus Auribacterota bacterium]
MEITNKIVNSFNCAIEGLSYILRTQRNFRIHFLFAVFIILLGLYFGVDRHDFMLLVILIFFVLVSEIFNTCIELVTDMVSETYHPIAKIIKDISAGAVLLASSIAAIVGYIIFVNHLETPLEMGINYIKGVPSHITIIAFILALSFAIIIKLILHRGKPLLGGMPSVHSTVAFAMWGAIIFISHSGLLTAIGFLLALMVAQSRVAGKIHSIYEVVAGAVLGILLSIVLFQIFM